DAAPLYGVYSGFTLKETIQGSRKAMFRADPAKHVLTITDLGWAPGSTNTYTYQGKTYKGYLSKPDPTHHNVSDTCTATTLHYHSSAGTAQTEQMVSSPPSSRRARSQPPAASRGERLLARLIPPRWADYAALA